MRGEEHINNTPRQINLYRALGWTPPQFRHLPLILAPDGSKLSKRHGAVSVLQYDEDGFPRRCSITLHALAGAMATTRNSRVRSSVVRFAARQSSAGAIQPRQVDVAQWRVHQGSR